VRSPELETLLPSLNADNYDATSDQTIVYNCIAWAMGETYRWWGEGYGPSFWPPGAESHETAAGWRQVFEVAGYETCDDSALEEGFEKVAIYTTVDGAPQHVARQLESGKWTSKMGRMEDITHDTLEIVEHDDYGRARIFMKRRRGELPSG
jgi:hypothetical protein